MGAAEYRAIQEGEVGAAARMIHHAFAGPLEGAEKWLRESGLAHMRVMSEGGAVGGAGIGACLLRIPMGQFFGGKSVKMLGIAGVAVAPEQRGRGLARRMMEEAVREAAAEGFAISTLYPSTPALYRKSGYEFAGHRFSTTIPVGRIDVRERGAGMRALDDADVAAVQACYARMAPSYDGMLDRSAYCWARVRDVRGEKQSGFGVEDGAGGLDGYVYLSQARDAKTGFHHVMTTDLVFATGAAGRRLMGFLADFGTMGENAVLWGGPIHPCAALMGSRHCTVEKKDYWMVRVLDVKRAFESRGYAPGLRGSVVIEVEDEVIAGNAGVWRVEVEGAVGRVEKVARGGEALRCHVRALGPLLSGLYSARQLVMMGWMEGDAGAVERAGGVFGSGGMPWMIEMF